MNYLRIGNRDVHKIRLALLINTLGGGGAEKIVLDLCRLLDKSLFQIYIIYWNDGSYLNDFRKIKEITLIKLKHQVTRGDSITKEAITFFQIQKELQQLYRKYRWDILHSHLAREDIQACVLKILNRKLLIISTKHNTDPFRVHLFSRLIFGFINKIFDKIIACSNIVKKFTSEYEFYPLKKILTIYNGVDLSVINNAKKRDYPFLKKSDFNIIAVGRLIDQKGYPNLIEAFRIFNQKVPNSRLIIRGDGEEKARILQLFQSNKLTDHALILEKRYDLYDVIKSCDIFALFSNWEGFSVAFLEAMAVGLPVVGSNIECMREEIISGVNGFLVDRFNPEDGAEKFLQLSQKPELREEMGRRGMDLVRTRFTVERMVENYAKQYQKILRQN